MWDYWAHFKGINMRKSKVNLRGLLQQFCITQPFSTCGNTVVLELCAYVTESILRCEISLQAVKNYVATRKITMAGTPATMPKDRQRSLIQFLTVENVSGSEIPLRKCVWCVA